MENIEKIILKYNRPGPRYTSYPPAVYFDGSYGNEKYLADLKESNNWQPAKLSFYFHVPFCPRLCHFCGCNTQITRDEKNIERYMRAMMREMDNVLPKIDPAREVTQVHWGGGTPNSISPDFIEPFMRRLQERFGFAPGAEVAMECNPAYLEPEHIDRLREMGFNRLSLGVQDLDEKVLKTVNRLPSRHSPENLILRMRERGFTGVNIDLIYGLPGQTVESFTRTLDRIAGLRPDRLVTFSYAHVPWVKGAQKILEQAGIPEPEEKLRLFRASHDRLTDAGYLAVGMDHYALPQDTLAKAKLNGTLHRNFQGYCTRETTGQVVAFGASSISQLEYAYSQNEKEAGRYIGRINETGLAVERGYRLNREEHAVRASINQLMCNGKLEFASMAASLSMEAAELKTLLRYERKRFRDLTHDGLAGADEKGIEVTEAGMMLVRVIAMQIDPREGRKEQVYSKVI